MTGSATVQEVVASHDEKKIEEKLIKLLETVGSGEGSSVTIYCAQLCSIELQRIAVQRLRESSKRLEMLTKILIVLTAVLIVVGVPPLFDAIRPWFRVVR